MHLQLIGDTRSVIAEFERGEGGVWSPYNNPVFHSLKLKWVEGVYNSA